MRITLKHLGQKYYTDLNKGIDLSSVYGDKNRELKAWGTQSVIKKPVKVGEQMGKMKRGNSVNFYDLHFNPHGNGTHTESVGHISSLRESVNRFSEYHFIAYLLFINPIKQRNDLVVKCRDLKKKLKKWNFEVLVIKTGNYPEGYNFTGTNPPYFEKELINFIREMGIIHFITDLPSIDREQDEGKLEAHKSFWNFPDDDRNHCTITEMARIPEKTKTGLYLLNLQIAPFENDATPSRPIIYPLEELVR